MVIKFGKWFELEVFLFGYKSIRVGLIAICYEVRKSPRNYFEAYKMDGCYYLLGFGREVMVSTNG